LQFEIAIPPELASMQVPPLILQPLVENAVRHGIAPKRLGGAVFVEAKRDPTAADLAIITVRDTGRGATAENLSEGRARGVGLANVERRLAGHYGAAAGLRVDSVPDLGTTVVLRVPLNVANDGHALEGVAV
jgi:sensor histidine kinase YesM